jgi:hypothetical protein
MFVVCISTSIGWLVWCECASYVEAYHMADSSTFACAIYDSNGNCVAD